MKSQLVSLAKLSSEDLKKISALEKRIGLTLLAYSWCQGPELADLSPELLEEIKKLEDELGINLIALDEYKAA